MLPLFGVSNSPPMMKSRSLEVTSSGIDSICLSKMQSLGKRFEWLYHHHFITLSDLSGEAKEVSCTRPPPLWQLSFQLFHFQPDRIHLTKDFFSSSCSSATSYFKIIFLTDSVTAPIWPSCLRWIPFKKGSTQRTGTSSSNTSSDSLHRHMLWHISEFHHCQFV